MTSTRFLQTTIDKMCEAENSNELHKIYCDAKNGWKTATGEDRGGFDRLRIPQIYRMIIENVYYKILYLLIQKEHLIKEV